MTKPKTRTSPRIGRKSITESSGNVFADLGLPNPEQELTNAELTLAAIPHHQAARNEAARSR
jgi:hypothetical protein